MTYSALQKNLVLTEKPRNSSTDGTIETKFNNKNIHPRIVEGTQLKGHGSTLWLES